ncbi:MAG: HAMP domain-containing sensor histidine kinase [Ilumatobacter sp.]|uniref:sensor histidine kinase n=1 Tax=Ilumatobacter sp. TaxID=1967498 RepID=UPI0032991C06
MSLRSRLALLFALVALATSAMVGAFTYRTTTRELSNTIDRFLEARVRDYAQDLRALGNDVGNGEQGPGPGRVRPGQVRFFDGLPVADDDAIVQITRDAVSVRSSTIELPAPSGLDTIDELPPGGLLLEDIDLDGESYRMASRAFGGGVVVQVARSTSEADAVRSALVGRFAVIASFVALLAAGLGWLIASRTTAPLRRLTSLASVVGASGGGSRDLSAELGVVAADAARDDEIGQLAAGFRSMLERLEASRRQQHRLIHDAGHELRTPLTSLRMNVEMLERAGDLPMDQRNEILGAIRSELVELGDLFDEMIDLATDQRDVDFRPVPVDLDDVVRSVVARWERRGDRPIRIESRSSVVDGDPVMLARAVDNLVSNADKFSPSGAPIDVVVRDGSVSVRDAGPGIPVAERSAVFGRFHRSETTRSMPGSGLGLSIVAQIVEVHGGQVWASESPAGGADVGFTLPVLLPD